MTFKFCKNGTKYNINYLTIWVTSTNYIPLQMFFLTDLAKNVFQKLTIY